MSSSSDPPNEREEDDVPAIWIKTADEPPMRNALPADEKPTEETPSEKEFDPNLASDLKEEFAALYYAFDRLTGRSTAAYQVPKRFGMGPLMGMMLLYSLIFASLRWGGGPHWTYLFLGLLGVVIGFGQMQGEANPRFSSVLTGALALPGCVLAYMAFIAAIEGGMNLMDLLGGVCVSFGLFFVGGFVGYLVGTVLAGVFLVGDQAEQAFYRWTGQSSADVSDNDASHERERRSRQALRHKQVWTS